MIEIRELLKLPASRVGIRILSFQFSNEEETSSSGLSFEAEAM